jgi:acyl-CoA hydrolase
MSKKSALKSKTPAQSETIKTEVVFPNDANPMGMLQGGRMVQWMDIAAAVCAQLHAGKICVTASVDKVVFHTSARIGDIITIRAVITRAFTTSMEIHVTAFSRSVISQETNRVSEAYFTFVALDGQARPTAVPPVLPITKIETTQFNAALLRKKQTVKMKSQL